MGILKSQGHSRKFKRAPGSPRGFQVVSGVLQGVSIAFQGFSEALQEVCGSFQVVSGAFQ